MNFGTFSIDSTTKNIAGRAFSGAGAFKSLIVDDDPTLVNLLAYVDLNPFRAGIVKRPEDYKWCSLGYFTRLNRPLVYGETVFNWAGGNSPQWGLKGSIP